MAEAIVLQDADPDWPAAFDRERTLILLCLPSAPVLIEHMGSTAIPGLPAKPIIDIIVLVDDLDAARAAIPPLVALGYQYRDDHADTTKLFLMKLSPDGLRTHHLHLHDDAGEVRRHLIFRDALRADPALRDAYRDLKIDLATRYRDDRMAYSTGKTAFVDAVVASAGGPARRVNWDPPAR